MHCLYGICVNETELYNGIHEFGKVRHRKSSSILRERYALERTKSRIFKRCCVTCLKQSKKKNEMNSQSIPLFTVPLHDKWHLPPYNYTWPNRKLPERPATVNRWIPSVPRENCSDDGQEDHWEVCNLQNGNNYFVCIQIQFVQYDFSPTFKAGIHALAVERYHRMGWKVVNTFENNDTKRNKMQSMLPASPSSNTFGSW